MTKTFWIVAGGAFAYWYLFMRSPETISAAPPARVCPPGTVPSGNLCVPSVAAICPRGKVYDQKSASCVPADYLDLEGYYG